MKTTSQQNEILESIKQHKNIKINAFAGTGKTSTLELIASRYKDKKILYLAFNTSIKQEASQRFGSNVSVKTTHGLGFSAVKKHTNIDLNKPVNYRAIDISKQFDITYNQAISAIKIFENFCNNTQDEIKKDDIEHKTANSIFTQMLIGKMLPTHSFYLKYYYLLLKTQQIPQFRYDIIMLDEAQDTNEVTLGIFEELSGKTKIYVGDTHQQIYSFRGSKNALEKIKSNAKLNLSISFRFNNTIASYANTLLKNFKNEDIQIESFQNSSEPIDTHCFLSRTNATLISTIASRIEIRKPFVTVRDPNEIFNLTIEVHYFLSGKKQEIKKNRFLKDFIDEEDLMAYAKEVEDFELKSAIKVAREYKDAIFEFKNIADKFYSAWQKRSNNGFEKRIREILFLSTVHTSKGLEWDSVTVADDFADFAELLIDLGCNSFNEFQTRFTELQQNEILDEFNIFYVAITRAKKEILKDSQNFHYLISDNIERLIDARIKEIKQDISSFVPQHTNKRIKVSKIEKEQIQQIRTQRNIKEGKAAKSGTKWSLEDKIKVKSMFKQNKTIVQIAAFAQRTPSAILGELVKSEVITPQEHKKLNQLLKTDPLKVSKSIL